MRTLLPNLHSVEHGSIKELPHAWTAPAKALFAVTRLPLGMEVLSPVRAIVRSLLLLMMPFVFWFIWQTLTGNGPPPHEGREFIFYYVGVTFAVTLLRFMKRVVGQNCGEEIHTADAGYCFVTRILFFVPVGISELFIVPGLIGWAGFETGITVSFDLGVWLMVCSLSYFLVASWELRNRLAQRRAPVDDKIRASLFTSNIDTHEHKVKEAKQRKAKGRGKAASIYAAGAEPDIAEFGRGKRSV